MKNPVFWLIVAIFLSFARGMIATTSPANSRTIEIARQL